MRSFSGQGVCVLQAQTYFVSFAANAVRRKGCKNMSRVYKTSQKKRTNYIYYTAEGTKIVITPGEDGVTEADIELLHTMDDEEVDEQRRYDYRVTTHLDAYHDGEEEAANDRNKYLADDTANPEQLIIQAEYEADYQDMLDKLTKAMESLLPQQKELFKKVYLERRSNTDIAAEEGVTEAAIRNRLKKLHERLRKNLS
ncbi:sigma-70 family RNA polymerase sigma factor [Clostridioides difficile]|uniref:RNA polymerase sigma factor n=1 Tax=Clostridioides difficile TaxID=1496 RepID=UPI0009439FEF|nr:sigma-70 family RNA polymerase sigma factor [Clostridioides difficile]EKG0820798.1 sigma-70 family RNA polymerase sigma factor [Clostridioides difficile]MBH7228387.1 sigma-70 family RNA polymerase sigma factor [Clostridioides difficile]MBH7790478.1 sigma-70 family RNA polymerase sigma factor [Clostridioides difficile]MBH7867092.1 sigma-70 family RNA polymerase sigma factor [Clostridioides difficile]MBY1220026.1 sigma-70 family RNA polymerase sigma factor [Clostridioides difficile]